MRSIVPGCLATALLFAPCTADAEDGKIEASLEIRARVEAIDGQFRPNVVGSDGALLTRILAFAEYDAGPVRIGGEILDGRAFFYRTGSSVATTEVNTLEPIQAYIATDVSKDAKLLAGRFTLNLGSRRLIARNQFRNTINSYTGVQGVLGDTDRGATLFWMIPQTRLPDQPDRLRDGAVVLDRERGGPRLFGAWGHARIGAPTLETYLYRLAERDDPGILTRDRHLWTAGARIFRAPSAGHYDTDIEAAYQWGRARQTTAATDLVDRDVAAGLVHAEGGYTIASGWQPRPSIGFDFGSGDGSSARYTRFDTLFGARAFDYGPTSFYGLLTRSNLVSPFVRLDTKPDKRTDTQATIRPLWLASRTDQFTVSGVRDATGTAGRYAGVQLDARVRRALIPDRLRVSAGAVYLSKGRFLEDAANAPATGDTRYGYIDLTATF